MPNYDIEKRRVWEANNKPKRREQFLAWCAKNPERRRALRKAAKKRYRANHPERYKESRWRENIKRAYGIDFNQYKSKLSAQSGLCAICGSAPDRNRLCVDHDHKTGVTRDLLCNACNIGIGAFKEKQEFLIAASMYLDRHRSA